MGTILMLTSVIVVKTNLLLHVEHLEHLLLIRVRKDQLSTHEGTDSKRSSALLVATQLVSGQNKASASFS